METDDCWGNSQFRQGCGLCESTRKMYTSMHIETSLSRLSEFSKKECVMFRGGESGVRL